MEYLCTAYEWSQTLGKVDSLFESSKELTYLIGFSDEEKKEWTEVYISESDFHKQLDKLKLLKERNEHP